MLLSGCVPLGQHTPWLVLGVDVRAVHREYLRQGAYERSIMSDFERARPGARRDITPYASINPGCDIPANFRSTIWLTDEFWTATIFVRRVRGVCRGYELTRLTPHLHLSLADAPLDSAVGVFARRTSESSCAAFDELDFKYFDSDARVQREAAGFRLNLAPEATAAGFILGRFQRDRDWRVLRFYQSRGECESVDDD